MSPSNVLHHLNIMAGNHGIGRDDIVEIDMSESNQEVVTKHQVGQSTLKHIKQWNQLLLIGNASFKRGFNK